MINWSYFPRSDAATELAVAVVSAFDAVADEIDSGKHTGASNAVLALVKPHLEAIGFRVELSKFAKDRIRVPVLFGRNGKLQKSFDADAHHISAGFVVEVEAGRGVTNYQFLKDLFQACMMDRVFYLAIAVRNTYRGNQDFEIAERFFDTMYASNRLQLPLKGILLIGY